MDTNDQMSSGVEAEVTVSQVGSDSPVTENKGISGENFVVNKDLAENLDALTLASDDNAPVKADVSTDEPRDPRVQVLRERIPAELTGLLSDADCLRFLRARNFNIDKSTEMIEKWGKWWFTPLPGTDMLPKDAASGPDPHEEVYRELMPHSNLGETKTGCPLYWEKTGQISSVFYQVKKFLTEDEIFVRHIRQQEVMVRRLRNASERHQRQIDKQVIVMDMRNVVMTPDFMATRVFHRTVVIDEACYPERLHMLFMINAPFTFSVLWALIKPWIDPVTVEKFKIIGSNYQDTLKEHIAEDQIPVEYGGTWENFGWTFPDNISEGDRLKKSESLETTAVTVTEGSTEEEGTEKEVVEENVDGGDATPVSDSADCEPAERSVEIVVSA